MTRADKFRMPDGLPIFLGSGKAGFDALCELLDINTTRQKQSILKSSFVKQTLKARGHRVSRQAKTAERIQNGLIAMYGDPSARRELWRGLIAGDDDTLDPGSSLIPSIEYEALKRYDEDLVSAEFDTDDLEESSEFYAPEAVADSWRSAAIIALPHIKDDFDRWKALSPERQQEVLIAAYAVCTVLDDVRLLHWAAERIEDVASQCPFLLSQEVDVHADNKEQRAAVAAGDSKEEDVLLALYDAARDLSAAALQLVDKPVSNDLFDVIAAHAATVEGIREPAIQEVASRSVEALVGEFAAHLNEKSKQAPWLAGRAEEIVAAWHAACASDGGPGLDELNADLERAGRELSIHLDTWIEAHANEVQTKTALKDLLAATNDVGSAKSSDRDLEYKYYEEIPKFGRAAMDAMEKAVKAALPAVRAPETPSTRPDDPQTKSKAASVPAVAPKARSAPEDERAPVNDAPSPVDSAEGSKPSERLAEKPVDRPDEVPAEDDFREPAEVSAVTSAPISPVEGALWTALHQGQLGIAYHIARLNEEIEEAVSPPSSELLATLALGSFVSGPEEGIVHEFGRRVGTVLSSLDFGNVDQQTKDALNLLVFSASLRPALFAPQQTGAIPMLNCVELSSGFTPVYRFREAMARHAEKLIGVQLDVSTLAAVFDEEVWQNRWERHLERVANWRSSPVPRFMFAPANHVWRHWTGSGGVLATLMDLVSHNNASSAQRVRDILHSLTSKSVHALFEDTWRNELGQRIGGGASGRAVAQLERHLQEPVELARKWLRVVRARPRGSDWAKGEVEKLRRDIRNYGQTALKALREGQQGSPGLPLEAAIRRAIEAIEALERLLLRDFGVDTSASISAVGLLSSDLVHVPALPLDEHGQLDASVSTRDALAVMVDAEGYVESLGAAFDARFANDDLHGARAVCLSMSRVGDPNETNCRQRLKDAIAARVRNLRQQLYDLTEKLEQSFIMGEVAEDEYADLNASISTARQMLDRNDDDQTLTAITDVQDIEESVGRLYRACIEKTKQRLKEHQDRLGSRENALVQDALDAGDLIALHEYVDCLEAKRPLVWTETDECESLKRSLALVDRMSESPDGTQGPTQDAIIRAAARREDILELKFSALSTSDAKQSAGLIEAWYLLARHGTANWDRLRDFLGRLGFAPKSAKTDRTASGTLVAVKTDPLRNRASCPVHSFGSAAEGHYDVLLNWNPTARASVIQAVGSNPNRHTIVLHFGRISRDDRLWLRRWSIKNSNQFIVVDETLVLYLASLPSVTLRPLFDCTLPFTCVEPFFTAAGLMPPESFYGRENERRSIMDRYGSCFVYGGRQLGKTALLRSAEAVFHRPEKRHIAHCIDLKKYAIGTAVGADHLWNVLWDEFSKLGIITVERQVRRGRDRLVRDLKQAVMDWLSTDEHSQILLLLDEADDFLSDDLKRNFRESGDLKGLMDDTRRRFKVVLCGLHNVLRNTERANHPLAHFGSPICVGPLLGNGDREQARALVKEPMAAAGYTFEKDSLLTHILVWTNYYPSLIQLFGEALLKHLRETKVGDFPRSVTRADIEAVFARDGFRDYIRQRFALTLQLDQRYEVIAYAIAFELHVDPSGTSRGFTANEALALAQNAWPEGFDISGREFDTLMREMCGLGILRRRQRNASTARYTFRNPNVLLLFGNAETILDVLEKTREMPEMFEAGTYHAQYPRENSPPELRGPLTFEQEGLLKDGGRVAVLCGTRIANLGSCGEFLSQRLDSGLLRQLEPCMDSEVLRRKLNGLRPGRSTYVCMVDNSDPWAMRWIETTADMLTKGKVGATLRVVFCADADRLWDLVSELPDEYLDEQPNGRFDWVGTQPWNRAFLHRWCVDQNFHEAAAHLDELLDITGGWPQLLEHYARSGHKSWKGRRYELQDHVVTNRAELIEALGLESDEARQQMNALRECGDLTLEDVDEYASLVAEEGDKSYPSGTFRRRLFWAIQLGLAQDMGGSWRLNPLVERLLADSAR